jgi:hypothetical protein
VTRLFGEKSFGQANDQFSWLDLQRRFTTLIAVVI